MSTYLHELQTWSAAASAKESAGEDSTVERAFAGGVLRAMGQALRLQGAPFAEVNIASLTYVDPERTEAFREAHAFYEQAKQRFAEGRFDPLYLMLAHSTINLMGGFQVARIEEKEFRALSARTWLGVAREIMASGGRNKNEIKAAKRHIDQMGGLEAIGMTQEEYTASSGRNYVRPKHTQVRPSSESSDLTFL